jgi:membrane protein
VIKVLRQSGHVAWRAFLRFQDHNGPDRAAAVAYYTLLSLLPLLIFLISIGVALLGSFDVAYQGTLYLIRGVVIHLDPKSLDELRGFVEHSLRFQLPGLLLLAWTSRRIFAALFSALETIFGVPGRHWAKHNLVAFGSVLLTGMAVLVTMALTMLMATSEGLLMRFRQSGTFQSMGGVFVSSLLPMMVSFSFFYVIYRVVPRRVVRHGDAMAGALLATVLWEGAKSGFAYYLRNVAQYAGVYGALEAVIVLALWLEISVSIVLYCGEVVALIIVPARTQRRIAFAPPVPAEAKAVDTNEVTG